MAPVAVDMSYSPLPETLAAVPVKGNALIIGSLTTAQDGSYQALVEKLEAEQTVERQLVDRIADQGTTPRHCGTVSQS
jgi:anamorsin